MGTNNKTDKKKTGRRGWYDSEVEKWLLESLDECKKCRGSKKSDVFYTSQTRELYLKFPAAAAACAGSHNEESDGNPVDSSSASNQVNSSDEADFIRKVGWDKLTPSQFAEKKSEFMKCRHKVGKFYRRKMHGGAAPSDKILDKMMASVVPNKPQKLTAVQMFGKLYRESLILPIVEKEWSKACDEYKKSTGIALDADSNGADEEEESGSKIDTKKPVYIALYNRIVKDVYEQQSEETKQHVAEEVEQNHREGLEDWQAKKDAKLDEEKSPEELEMTLNKLGVAACRFANATANKSKRMVSIVFIGPNGRDGGNIELKWVHVGSTPGGLIWPEYDPKAFSATEQSLVQFGNQCFNAESRAARAISSSVAATIIRNHQRPGPGRNSANIVRPPQTSSVHRSAATTPTSPVGSVNSGTQPASAPQPQPQPNNMLKEVNSLDVPSRRAVSLDPDLDIPINFPGANKAYRPLPLMPILIPPPSLRRRSNSDAATAQPDPALFPRLRGPLSDPSGAEPRDSVAQEQNNPEAISSFQKGAAWPFWSELIASYVALEEYFDFQEQNGKFSTRKENPAIKIFQKGNGDCSDDEVKAARAKFPKAWQAWWRNVVPDEEANGFYPLDSISGQGGLYKLVLGLFWWGKWMQEEESEAASDEEKDLVRSRKAEWAQAVGEVQEMITNVLEYLQPTKGRKHKAAGAKNKSKKRKTDSADTGIDVRITRSHKPTERELRSKQRR
ncbi:hypothetical protein VKT23_015441 [Stygiomarasmius scandens]|uniref:Uncharacterized protein n=1 Tax=Marasmiellus scandens TaxID=2682957 RepID=A0ABR1J060_9AGAR